MAVNKNDNNIDDSSNIAEQGQEFHANLNSASESAKKNAEAAKSVTEDFYKLDDVLKDSEETFEKFNDALNALPGRLHLITKQMNKNMMFVSGELHDSFIKGKLTEKLWEVKKAFGEQQEELDEILKRAKQAYDIAVETGNEEAREAAERKRDQAQEAVNRYKSLTDTQKLNKKLSKEMSAELLKLGKKMFSDLWDYAKKLLNSAYADSKSTIQQSYSTVMSYNSYSQGEYAKVIDDLKAKIEESGLGDVISVNTLQENLVKTLQTGLQGALAETNAYYASVAEKSGITFDWYSSDWTDLISQMARTGKDYEAVMKSVITATDDLAEIYGDSKGLADGKANQYMSAASKLGTTYNLDSDAVANIYKSMAITSQELSTYVDPTTIMADITKVLESGINNDRALLAFATNGMNADQVKAEISAGNFDKLITNYMSNLEGMFRDQNGEMITTMQSALGSSFSVQDYHALDAYWDNAGNFTNNFNESFSAISSDITDVTGELKNYATTEEKFKNRLENWMAGISEWMVQNPIAEVILTTLMGGIGSIITILIQYGLNRSLLSKFSGGGGSSLSNASMSLGSGFKNFFGGSGGVLGNAGAATELFKDGATFSEVAAAGGKGSAILGKAGQLFSNGTAFASKGGGLAKFGSTVFSTGGKALGVAGSLISMGVDAVQGYQEGGAEGAIKGAITGSGKDAETGWDVAKGAGSGALKGAGIGMVFGPWGAAIGAAVGGLAGLAVGLNDLYDEEKKYQRQVEKARTSFATFNEALTQSSQQLNDVKQTKATIEETDKLVKSLKEGQEPTAKLLENFGEYSIYLDSNGKVTKEYISALKENIENQKILADLELQKIIKQSNDDVFGKETAYNTLSKDVDITKGKLDSAIKKRDLVRDIQANAAKGQDVSVSDDFSTLNVNGVSYNLNDIAKMFNMAGESPEAILSEITDKWMGDYFNSGGTIKRDGSISHLGQIDLGNGKTDIAWRFNDTNEVSGEKHIGTENPKVFLTDTINDDVTTAQENYGQANSELNTAYNSLKSWVHSTFTQWGLQNVKSAEDFVAWQTENSYKYFSNYYADADKQGSFKNAFNKYNKYLEETLKLPNADEAKIKQTYGSIKPSEIKEYFLAANPDLSWSMTPAFAVGTTGDAVIPYDNYLANLHEGEQIRTKAEVTVERAEQHVASSDAITKVHDALLTQTNTIISILTNIYTVLTQAKPAHTDTKMVYDLPGI